MTDKDKIKQIQIVDVAALVNFPLIRVGKSLQSAHCPNGCVSKKGTSFSVDPEKNMFIPIRFQTLVFFVFYTYKYQNQISFFDSELVSSVFPAAELREM